MTSLQRALVALPVVFALAAVSACSSVDNVIDCHTICKRYGDCFNSSYDVGACETRCKNNSASDQNFQSKVNTCDACIDDKSCASATFNCAPSCNGIVP
jgi:hypothetical protein